MFCDISDIFLSAQLSFNLENYVLRKDSLLLQAPEDQPIFDFVRCFWLYSSYYVLTSLTKSLLSKTTQMNTAVGYSDGGGL